ncbi:MAG: hypothetical protein FJY82_13790 [Candidatus Aminicenantes bacterium]|nr:hypothetical protein [Candidatus Aminicenantes bacterium]
MKKKIGTVMEDHLLYGAKKAALEKDAPLSRIFEEALEAYLARRTAERDRREIVRATRGIFKLDDDEIREAMDEPGLFES